MPIIIRIFSYFSNDCEKRVESSFHRVIHNLVWISLNCGSFAIILIIFKKISVLFYKILK